MENKVVKVTRREVLAAQTIVTLSEYLGKPVSPIRRATANAKRVPNPAATLKITNGKVQLATN